MKRLQRQIERLGYGMLEWLAKRLPGRWIYVGGERLADLVWPGLRHRRRVVVRNLRIAFCDSHSPEEIEELARRSFRRTGANLLSAAHSAALPPADLPQVLEIDGWEAFEAARAGGRGVVMVLAHMGNWELLSRVVHLLPERVPVGAFYRPLNHEALDAAVRARREADGVRMFSKRDPFHQACRFLRDGGVLGILADQRVGRQGTVVPFFGRLTRCSPLPSLLARRTRSAILGFSLRATRPGHWRGSFVPVASATVEDSMKALEQAMTVAPEEVFWLQDRWRCYAHPRYGIRQWLGEDGRRGAKPHRALLWVGPAAGSWSLPEAWQHDDVRYEVVVAAPGWTAGGGWTEARRHALPRGRRWKAWLAAIDRGERLPLDFVLAVGAPPGLAKACRALAIEVVALDPAG